MTPSQGGQLSLATGVLDPGPEQEEDCLLLTFAYLLLLKGLCPLRLLWDLSQGRFPMGSAPPLPLFYNTDTMPVSSAEMERLQKLLILWICRS